MDYDQRILTVSVPSVLDVGYCLVGGCHVTQLVIKNEGGSGRFCIMPSTAWPTTNFKVLYWGCLGEAKVLSILHHRVVQLIVANSWASPAIPAAGKGRGGMFLFLPFLHFHSFFSFSPVLSFISSNISSISLFIAPLWKSGVILDLPCPSMIPRLCHSVILWFHDCKIKMHFA